MKAERQSKSASCDIMTAMRAMHVRLCGLGYAEPTARAAGTTTSKQQSMRLAMAMGSLAMGSTDRPTDRPTDSQALIGRGVAVEKPLLGK